jgi:hypothetical protein
LLYPEYNISIPIDHIHNDTLYLPHSSDCFNLRYWFDASYYKPGGPVIVLQSGEADGTERLVYLQKGLLHEMIEATNGIGVVLEHRYYGTSFPFPDLSTDNLRFLTTDQALADEVYFAKNVVFEGLEHLDLTAAKVPYIGYGGSYAGAFNAFLRKLYPDVFWGELQLICYFFLISGLNFQVQYLQVGWLRLFMITGSILNRSGSTPIKIVSTIHRKSQI